MSFTRGNKSKTTIALLQVNDFNTTMNFLLNWLEINCDFNNVKAIEHRIVNGTQQTEELIITVELLEELN